MAKVKTKIGNDYCPWQIIMAAPVLAPGENTYSSIDGRYLGKWGEPMKNLTNME